MDRIELDELIEQTENVTERMSLLRKGWEMADEEKDYDAQIGYRLDYLSDACFYADVTEIYMIFPKILQLHDEHVKEYGYDHLTPSILWDYKWLLENANEFYHISVAQFEALFEDCKRRYQENNYSLRPLYSYRFSFYLNIDREKAKEAYRDFQNQRRDWRSDCHACERCKEVQYFLALDDFAKAAKAAQPLVDGELKCAEQPECTLGDFLRYYNGKLLEGDEDYAQPAGELCEQIKRIIDRKGTANCYKSEVLLYYALMQPSKALGYFKKHRSFFETNRDPVNRYWFAIAALAFLSNLSGKETYKMELDPTFPLYNENDEYNVKEMTDYYKDKALDIASKMDQRNGTDNFTKRFEKVMEQLRVREGSK